MSSNLLGLLEMGLIFGLVLAFGWHQLRDLKRYKDKEAQQESDRESERNNDG